MTKRLELTDSEQIWIRECVIPILQDNIDCNDYNSTLETEFQCKRLIDKILHLDMNTGYLPNFINYLDKKYQEAAKGGKAANAERQVTDVGMVCRPEHKPPRKSLKPIGKVGLELLRGERSKEVKE